MSKLDNKVALVTGGSRGIGKAITVELAKNMAKVYFTYNQNFDLANELANQINDNGGAAIACQMDVKSRDSIKSVMKKITDENECLDILVNNAGINKPTDFDQITDSDWDDIFTVNLKGPFICVQEAIDIMKQSNSGSIINIGSVSGQYGGPRTAHYAASKAGLISLSQVMARFLAQYNIRCNTLAAGLIASEMAEEGLKSKAVLQAAESIVLKRLGTQEEVAKSVVYLASEDSSYVTAQTINVNGGVYF